MIVLIPDHCLSIYFSYIGVQSQNTQTVYFIDFLNYIVLYYIVSDTYVYNHSFEVRKRDTSCQIWKFIAFNMIICRRLNVWKTTQFSKYGSWFNLKSAFPVFQRIHF